MPVHRTPSQRQGSLNQPDMPIWKALGTTLCRRADTACWLGLVVTPKFCDLHSPVVPIAYVSVQLQVTDTAVWGASCEVFALFGTSHASPECLLLCTGESLLSPPHLTVTSVLPQLQAVALSALSRLPNLQVMSLLTAVLFSRLVPRQPQASKHISNPPPAMAQAPCGFLQHSSSSQLGAPCPNLTFNSTLHQMNQQAAK